MNKEKFKLALVLLNIAVFLLAVLFLPRSGSFQWQVGDPLWFVNYFIQSRTDWHIAFGVLLASVLISWAIYILVDSLHNQHPGDR